MKGYTFHTLISFCFILIIATLGFSLAIVSYHPILATKLIDWLQQENIQALAVRLFKGLGFSLSGLGLALFILFYQFNKKVIYQVRLDKKTLISIEPKLISQTLKEIFQNQEEGHIKEFKLKVNRGDLEIITNLSSLPLAQHEEVLQKIEPQITEALEKRFGFQGKITFSIFAKQA